MNEIFERNNREVIIHLPKELDHHNAEYIRQKADRIMEQYGIHKMIFDFTNTEFMDSSGIGVIIGRYKNMKMYGGVLEIQNTNDRIKRLLAMAGIKKEIERGKER